MSWRGVVYQNHMRVYNLENFFNSDVLNELFGNIFGIQGKDGQEKMLDDYWAHSKVKDYYEYLNEIKKSGKKVFRNNDGKHKIK